MAQLDDNDHRKLAQRFDLFHFQEEAPGMVFWHPKGLQMYRLLEHAVRAQLDAHGYREVKTPQILRRSIWDTSGHWQHFGAGMFRIDDQSCEAGVKPVSCPGHIQIVNRRAPSYRELPIRLCEFGVVHRDEPGGTLHGLLRLRQFTQDDGHVFCSEEQAPVEIERFCRSVPAFYAAFGFDQLAIAFSTRPAQRAGSDAAWDRAEAALEGVLRKMGVRYSVQAGEGAFYGPKIEFVLRDRAGRDWQCGTIQMDLVMPQSFELRYVDAGGDRKPLALLHRALYGSLERFLGIVLEHHGGALPLWLAPEQVRLLPVAEPHAPFAREAERVLREAGLRVGIDLREESLARRVAEAHDDGVPLLAIVGGREAEARALAVRGHDSQAVLPLAEAVAELARRSAAPAFGALPDS